MTKKFQIISLIIVAVIALIVYGVLNQNSSVQTVDENRNPVQVQQ